MLQVIMQCPLMRLNGTHSDAAMLRIAMLLGSTDANDPKHDCGTQHRFATNKVRIVHYPQSTGSVIIVYCCPMFPLRTCMLMNEVKKGF